MIQQYKTYWGSFLGVQCPRHNTGHSSTFSAKVKMATAVFSLPQHVFVSCIGTPQPFNFVTFMPC